MLSILNWLIFFTGIISIFYFQCNRNWGLLFSALLLLFLGITELSPLYMIFSWLIWSLVAVMLLATSLRLNWFTLPLLRWFRKEQPSLSANELDVLESGGLWWESQCFSGDPKWSSLFDYKKPELTVEEQHYLDNEVETFCALLNDWDITCENDLSAEAWDYLKKSGLWALVIPKKYNGKAFSALAHSAVITKIASVSPAAAITVMVPNALGPAEFLMRYGSKEQCEYYLPRLAAGTEIACFALTSLEAGSDATNIKDEGIICYDEFNNEKTLGIRLNFAKRYITLAPISTIMGLAFKLFDPDHLIGEQTEIGITVALVPTHLPGVIIGARHQPLLAGFLNGPLSGKNVFIPLHYIVGGVERRGQGWRMLMECLAVGRGISLPALAAGASKIECLVSSAYAEIRRQFHRPLSEFEGIALLLAEIGGYSYLIDSMRLLTAQAVDLEARPSIASAITKYHATELHRKTINLAMEIHGGRGVQKGPRNYLVNQYFGIPVSTVVEGANILTRNLIIFGQGVMRCHPFLKDEIIAASHALENEAQLIKFDHLLLAHISFTLSCATKTFIQGIFAGFNIRSHFSPRLNPFIRQLTRMSAAFAFVTDIALLTVGGKLKFKEALTARLGDILSYFYMASAVMKYYHDRQEIPQEWPLVEWSLHYCLAQTQIAFDDLLNNFPRKGLGKIMRFMIFPWGRSFILPKNELSLRVSQELGNNLSLRENLIKGAYLNINKENAVGRVESTFRNWQEVKSIFEKMKKMNSHFNINEALEQNSINAEEAQNLQNYLKNYFDALQVDEFKFEDNQGKQHESDSSLHRRWRTNAVS